MTCCSECFTSGYLKNIISNPPTKGNCDFCNSKDVPVVNPSSLSSYFQPILDLFSVNTEKGKALEVQIESHFKNKIFSDNVNIKLLLKEIVSTEAASYSSLFETNVILTCIEDKNNIQKVEPLQKLWENFAEEIKNTNRFHIQNVLDLTKLKDLLIGRYDKEIKKDSIFYRSRISVLAGLPLEEMGNPPPQKAKAGRANPTGISYLYLANEPKTTLYEARVSLYDYVTIGNFNVTEDIKVINLRGDTYDPIYLAETDILEDFLIHLPFIRRLEFELSKPRRRSDNELDYLPTQYLCEFIKSMGYDGVEYRSSLYSGGYNLAVFHPQKLTCTKVAVYEIEDIDLKHKPVN